MKKFKLWQTILVIILGIVVIGGAGFGVSTWRYNNKQKQDSLSASFVNYANNLVAQNNGKNIQLGTFETVKTVYTKEFQFTGADGKVYDVVAMEVGSHWVTLQANVVSSPTTPTPSTTPPTTATTTP